MGSTDIINRRIRFIILLMGLILAAAAESYAQSDSTGAVEAGQGTRSKFEAFSVTYLHIPKSSLSDRRLFFSPSPGIAELEVNLLEVNLNLPRLYRESRTVLVHSLSIQRLKFKLWELSAADPVFPGLRTPEEQKAAFEGISWLDDLAAVEYRILASSSFSEGRWRWWLTSRHGLYSDFSGGLSAGDYRVQAALGIDRTWGNGAVLGLGAAYSTTFSSLILPVLNFQTSSGFPLRLKLLLPFEGSLIYRISDYLELGLAGRIEGNRYNLRGAKSPLTGAPADNLRYSAGTLGLQAGIRLAGPCRLILERGFTFRNRLELYDGGRKNGVLYPGVPSFTRVDFSVEL